MTNNIINFLNVSAIDRKNEYANAAKRYPTKLVSFLRSYFEPNSAHKSRQPLQLQYEPDNELLISRQDLQIKVDKSTDVVVDPVQFPDNQHAVLLVRQAPDTSTTDQKLIDRVTEAGNSTARSPVGIIKYATDDFILNSIEEKDTERFVPAHMLRGSVIRTSDKSGREARIYGYTGTLVSNDVEKYSLIRMMVSWDAYLRATACIIDVTGNFRTRGVPLIVELMYHDQMRRGYLLSVQFSLSSAVPAAVSFSFQMYVTEAYSRSIDSGSVGTG